ncbi:MAG: APC family permease [Pseudomonadota bacterium]
MGQDARLHRRITWVGVFWVVTGVPALVLISMGDIAATVGGPAWAIWTVSVLIGFVQGFIYAELGGIFPNKSGGASVYGAAAWVRYAKVIAPFSVWCNWLAWSPVLAIGCGVAAGYLLDAAFLPEDPARSWEIPLADLSFLKEGLLIRIDSTFLLGAVLMLICFAIQHRGISGTARLQMAMGIAVILPLLLIGLVPLFIGEVQLANLTPFTPGPDPATAAWDLQGWSLVIGGLFLAAWTTYGFETAICYTSELTDPKRDTLKAIVYSGLLCILVFTLVPFTFQGALGLKEMQAPGIIDGTGVAGAIAGFFGGSGGALYDLAVVLMVLAVMLAIMTAMAGSARTLYQGSVDGWLPRYLGHVNEKGAPTKAMWTDLSFNLLLLSLSDYFFVLAVSNVCYIVFTFMNVNACWMHRFDAAHVQRPWRNPRWLLALAILLSFFNLFLLGAGIHVWGEGALFAGLVAILLIVPVFLYRHYLVDRGVFPHRMLEDLHLDETGRLPERRAGLLPFATLGAGGLVVLVSNLLF